MTNFTYSRTFALTASGASTALARSATGKCYDVADTARATPLSLTLVVGGTVVTQVSSDSNGQLPDFTTATRTSVVWKDNATGLESVLTTTDAIPGPQGLPGGKGDKGDKGDPGDIQEWAANTFYPLNQIICNPSAQLVTVTTAHTSTSTYDPTKFSPAGSEPLITAGTTGQYWRGDKTWQALNSTAVGLGSVNNTSDANKPVSTAQQTALNAKEPSITAGTTAQYWRGDKTWQTLNSTAVGLGSVNNTSDVNKPVSTAQQTALNAKLDDSQLGAANGVASLDATGHIPVAQMPASTADYGYLYMGFPGNGTYLERMQIYSSPDGKSVGAGLSNVWTDPNTGASFRDPDLIKIGSTWFCTYTINNGFSKNLGLIKSTDLVNWSVVTTIDVSTATSINQAWAPQFAQDTNGDIYIFFTNVTAANAQSMWRIKATNTTTLATWGSLTAVAWAVSPGNIWDAVPVWNGTQWVIFYAKVSTTAQINRATAATLTGTWTTDKTGDWAGWTAASPANTNFEAPEIVQVSSNLWRLYMDRYVGTNPYTYPGYCYVESADLTTWGNTPVTVGKTPDFPAASTLRHGAFIKLPDDASRNTVTMITGSVDQKQHAEFSGSFNITTGTVTAVGNPPITSNTTHDQFVTCQGSGLFTFAAAGEYLISADFRFTSGTGVTRSFAQMSNNGNTSVYQRTPGAAEDQFSLLIPSFKATAGLQVLIQAFGAFTGTGVIQATIRFTRVSW